MKLLYIYSKHDKRQLDSISRVQEELTGIVEVIESDEAVARGYHVFRTPCMIPFLDHLSGDDLLDVNVDGKLLLTATAYDLMDAEEKAIHNINHARLDSFVNNEKQVAVDDYTLTLLEGGIL